MIRAEIVEFKAIRYNDFYVICYYTIILLLK